MEIKFNLDDLDRNKYYWNHINSEKVAFSRNFGGGSLIIWTEIDFYGRKE